MRLELTVLGSASQAPTRERGQGGYVLRWDDEQILFDPGEGCQRQLLYAHLSAAHITRVCITHFHGDHCLGLPGFLQSRALTTTRALTLHYAGAQEAYVEKLLSCSVIDFDLRVRRQPLTAPQTIVTPRFELSCEQLDHPTPVIGYRLEAPRALHMLPDRLEAFGIEGGAVARIKETGSITVAGRVVRLDDVSEWRAGPAVAFVMDTAPCAGATRLAAGADLLICESTFLDTEVDLAAAHGHMTAAQAGRFAADAGVGLLVLTHFSGRYDDVAAFEAEAARHHPNVVAAHDLSTIVCDTTRA